MARIGAPSFLLETCCFINICEEAWIGAVPRCSSKEQDYGAASMCLQILGYCRSGFGGALSRSPSRGGLGGTSAFVVVLSRGQRAMDRGDVVPTLPLGRGVVLMGTWGGPPQSTAGEALRGCNRGVDEEAFQLSRSTNVGKNGQAPSGKPYFP